MLSLAAAGQRLSRFLQKEILSVVLPGALTLVGVYLLFAYGDAESKRHGGFGGIIQFLDDRELPSGRLVMVLAAVLTIYCAYVLGSWSRLVAMRATAPLLPRHTYLRDIWGAKTSVAEIFGDEAVNAALTRHLLPTLPPGPNGKGAVFSEEVDRQSRLSPLDWVGHRLGIRRRSDQGHLGLHTSRGNRLAAAAQQSPDSASIEYLRVEFNYCKVWLSHSDWRRLRIDFYEYEVNILNSLIIPIIVGALLGVKYLLFIATYNATRRVVIVVVLVLGAATVSYVLANSARNRSRFENFDAVRNLLFSELLASAAKRREGGDLGKATETGGQR